MRASSLLITSLFCVALFEAGGMFMLVYECKTQPRSFPGCGACCVDGVKQFHIPEENRNVFTVKSALCELQEFIFSG